MIRSRYYGLGRMKSGWQLDRYGRKYCLALFPFPNGIKKVYPSELEINVWDYFSLN